MTEIDECFSLPPPLQFGRKRRATDQSLANNGTVSDVRLSRRVRVISSEDISLTPDGRSAVTLTTGE